MRFSIVQMLMLVVLAALLIVFWQSERLGARESMIESMVFSPDGSRLAVVTITARRIRPMGMRTGLSADHADPARDIFTIETGRGSIQRSLLRESKNEEYVMMPLLARLWFPPTSQIAFNPKTKELAANSFEGDHVVYLDSEASTTKKLNLCHPVASVMFSRSGKWFGCQVDQSFTVFDATTLQKVRQLNISGSLFGGGGVFFLSGRSSVRVFFSHDETQVYSIVGSDILSWEIMASSKPTTIRFSADPGLNASHVEIAPDGSIFYCAGEGIVVTDAEGELRKKLVGLQRQTRFHFQLTAGVSCFLKKPGLAPMK